MDGKRITVLAIVLLLVGLLAGYVFWGYRAKQLTDELAAAKTRLAEAERARAETTDLTTKLQEAEGQLQQLTERVNNEREARRKLEVQLSVGMK